MARATLIAEGIADPESHIALIQSDQIATILVNSRPFSPQDIGQLKSIVGTMGFTPLIIPGEPITIPELQRISAARSLAGLHALRDVSDFDYSPTFDASPYFFNSLHIRNMFRSAGHGPNLRAMLFLFGFMLAALILVISTVILPATLSAFRNQGGPRPLYGALIYFIAIGLGFMLVEMAMMQQLSIFLGHPVYSMVVVLAGMILSAGVGSLVSDRWPVNSGWHSRIPAISAAVMVVAYSAAVLPVIHSFTAALLWQRVAVCLLLISPAGVLLGFCFPVGMRWMNALSQGPNLPWMWALNGAAGTLGSFIAIIISMEASIVACVLTGAACYLLAALGHAIPGGIRHLKSGGSCLRKRAFSDFPIAIGAARSNAIGAGP